MVGFPNCKINLGLHITQKRADGYHDLETVFYPIAINDIVEIISNHNPNPSTQVTYTSSGLLIEGSTNNNLCIKAYQLLKTDFPQIPAILLHLHKNIPMGAGLGGGSADGAFTLILLNQMYQLNLSETQLLGYALQLGSDCPFFIINKPALGKGRGEILTPIELNLSAYQILIINPGIHINTGWAFSQIVPSPIPDPLTNIISQPIHLWKDILVNDFEKPVCLQYPEIANLKSLLYQSGAIYASLSGSGSTVFALFKKGDCPVLTLPNHYYTQLVD